MKRRQGRKLAIILALVMLIAAGLLSAWLLNRSKPVVVMKIGEEPVYASEAMVYYRLMQLQFESMGGDNIWEISALGIDPEQTAIDRVLESMMRVKITADLAGSLDESEKETVREMAAKLHQVLGEDYMARHEITDDLLQTVMEENYKAYRYEDSTKFLAGSTENDIRRQMEEIFSVYDNQDQGNYLQGATILPMMFYTGEWVEDEWFSYPDAQKAVIRERAEEQLILLKAWLEQGKGFLKFASLCSDDAGVDTNPVFSAGLVRHPNGRFGIVYRGQIDSTVASAIFAAGAGGMTDLIETPYGYLVVEVLNYRTPSQADYESYELQVQTARETYRMQFLTELKAQRLEEEWQRLREESGAICYEEAWETYVKENK